MRDAFLNRLPESSSIPLIKLGLVSALFFLIAPLIPLLTGHTPLTAGFTIGTFLIFGLLLALIVVFAAAVMWVLIALTPSRLTAIRSTAQLRAPLMMVAGTLTLLITLLLTKRLQIDHGALPGTAVAWVQCGLFVWLLLITICTFLLLGPATLRAAVTRLETSRIPLTIPLNRVPLVGLTIFAVILAFIVVAGGLFTFPVLGDSSSHIYLGERLISGERPYESFILFQPPLRLGVTALWALTAAALNAPPLIVGRVYSVVMGIAILITVYLIAFNMTERPVSALVVPAMLVSMNAFFTAVIVGPNLKMGVTLMLGLAIVAAQRERWFWSGVSAGTALLMWLPSGGGVIGLFIAAFLQPRDKTPLVAAMKLVGGIVFVCALTALWLFNMGVLDNFYQQSIIGTWFYITEHFGQSNPAGNKSLLSNLLNLLEVASSWVKGMGLVIVIALPYTTYWALRLRSSRLLAPVLVVLLMLVIFFVQVQGLGDVITTLPFIVPFFGFLLCAMINAVIRYLDANAQNLRTATEAVLIPIILIYGLADVAFDLSLSEQLHLEDQQRLAADLESVLQPDDTVQMFSDHLWFLDITWRPNATRYLWLRPKSRSALEAENTSFEQIIAEVEAQNPAVIFLPTSSRPNEIFDWVSEHYTYMGILQGSGYQRIYVRPDREDIQNVLKRWPLEQN
jgi:hypothetical protein